MATPSIQDYKSGQLKLLPDTVGVYALCDLDEVPIYVGQSTDDICSRVRQHLISARSDVIANRQIDVWEIAFVWAWELPKGGNINELEAHLYNQFHAVNPLVNGRKLNAVPMNVTPPTKIRVQVIPDDEIKLRLRPDRRFPRQIQHFNQLVDYIANTQDKPHLRKALEVYFRRLEKYYRAF